MNVYRSITGVGTGYRSAYIDDINSGINPTFVPHQGLSKGAVILT